MKKIFFILSLFFTFLTFLLISCKKENTNNQLIYNLSDLLELQKLVSTPRDGYIGLDFRNQQGRTKVTPQLRATFKDKGSKLDSPLKNLGGIHINDFILPIGDNNVYSNDEDILSGNSNRLELANSLMGKKVKIKSIDNAQIGLRNGSDINTDFYIPAQVNGQINSSGDLIARNAELKWTPDPSNQKGFYIIIDFKNILPGNDSFMINPPVRRIIKTDDSGSYILKNEDLEGIPSGGRAYFTWGRGNYLVYESQREYLIYATATTSGFYRIM